MLEIDSLRREKLYRSFQFIGWSVFFVLYSSFGVFLLGFHWEILASYLNMVLVGFFLTHLYRIYVKKQRWLTLGMFDLSAKVTSASILIAIVWAFIIIPINYTFFRVEGLQSFSVGVVIFNIVNLSIVIILWSLVYFIFQLFVNFKKTEVEKWKLEAAVKDAELLALKSQINPHFIFNSLNNIRSLVVENPEKARDMITHLSGLLRYSIQFNNKERVSLTQELEIVQNYLNLESIQFEDRLKYTLEVKPETLEIHIPPMSVQLLVENAIKHGISNLPMGGEIRIRSYQEEKTLGVEVINTGQLSKEQSETGIGLRNASDRLKLLFGKKSSLVVRNLNDEYVIAKFTIPLKNKDLKQRTYESTGS